MSSYNYDLFNVDMIMGIEQNLPMVWLVILTIWVKNGGIKKRDLVIENCKILDEYI